MAVLKKGDVDLHTHITDLTVVDQYCRNGRGRDIFPQFSHKINNIYGCYGNHIFQILYTIAVVKEEF